MEMETGYVYMYICYFFHVGKEGPLVKFCNNQVWPFLHVGEGCLWVLAFGVGLRSTCGSRALGMGREPPCAPSCSFPHPRVPARPKEKNYHRHLGEPKRALNYSLTLRTPPPPPPPQ